MNRKTSPTSTSSLLRKILFGLFFSLIITSNNSAQGQTQEQTAYQSLTKAGIEQIRLRTEGDTVYASFESSQIRGSYRSLGIALQSLAKSFPDTHHFKLLLGEFGLPQIAIEATHASDQWQVSAHYDTHSIQKRLKAEEPTPITYAGNRGKIDVTFYPIVSIDNHILNKLARVGIYLAPSFETTLWRGNRFIVQPIIPVFTNIPDNDPESQFQWGVVGIRQDWLASKHWRSSSTIGLFLYNLAGLHHEVNYHLSRTFDLGLRLSATTGLQSYNGNWTRDRKLHLGAMAVADYYEPQTALQIKLAAGRFTYGDLGTRLDIVRHFGEYAIGAYAIYTDGERNAGFNFAIPLSSKRQSNWPNQMIRLRIPQYFSWEYSMLNYYRYAFEHMGVIYKEIPDKSFTTHYWQAAYIEHYLQRFLDNKIK